MKKNTVVDRDAVRELIIFAERCRAVYCGNTLNENIPGPVIGGAGLERMVECILKHITKGDYTDEGAVKGMRRVFDFAAKVYCRLYADAGFLFSPSTRNAAAVEYVESHCSDWHCTAVVQLAESLLYRRGFYDKNGDFFAAADEASDRDVKRAARIYGSLSVELAGKARGAQAAGENHVFYRVVLQKVQCRLSAWMYRVAICHGDRGKNSTADKIKEIITAAENLARRAV